MLNSIYIVLIQNCQYLNNVRGEDAKVGARGPHLGPVGHKDGAGQVPDHPAAQVDQPDPLGTDQLLEVAHEPVLEHQADAQMEYPEKNQQI